MDTEKNIEDCAPQADLPLHLLILYLIIDSQPLNIEGIFKNSRTTTR